jgi:hypothetical protein
MIPFNESQHVLTLELIQDVLQEYRLLLDRLSDEDLTRPLEADGWTFGQVFAHLGQSHGPFFMAKALEAAESAENADKALNEIGEMVFKNDLFPAPKIKMPEAYRVDPPQFTTLQQVLDFLAEAETLAIGLQLRLENANAGGRKGHRIFGYLTGPQWFRLGALHLRHHTPQVARLEALLRAQQ